MAGEDPDDEVQQADIESPSRTRDLKRIAIVAAVRVQPFARRYFFNDCIYFRGVGFIDSGGRCLAARQRIWRE
jgi:hypothetical protein